MSSRGGWRGGGVESHGQTSGGRWRPSGRPQPGQAGGKWGRHQRCPCAPNSSNAGPLRKARAFRHPLHRQLYSFSCNVVITSKWTRSAQKAHRRCRCMVCSTPNTPCTPRVFQCNFFGKSVQTKKMSEIFFRNSNCVFFHQSLSKGSTSPHSNLIERSMACKMCKICMVSTVCMILCTGVPHDVHGAHRVSASAWTDAR